MFAGVCNQRVFSELGYEAQFVPYANKYEQESKAIIRPKDGLKAAAKSFVKNCIYHGGSCMKKAYDLARGHVAALKAVEEPGVSIYNLGTGQGTSVLQLVNAFVAATGVEVPYDIKPRRADDIATCFADPSKAMAELGWKAKYDMERMCADSWRWQKLNPDGF